MENHAQETPASHATPVVAQCPIDHHSWPRQKTTTISDPSAASDGQAAPTITQDANGTWHVRGFQKSDIFLCHLLALENLRIQRPPDLGWNEVAQGYEIRNFIVELV